MKTYTYVVLKHIFLKFVYTFCLDSSRKIRRRTIMAIIQKHYAISVAVLGVISLLFGFGVAISSWMLKAKTDEMTIIEGNVTSTLTTNHSDIVVFDSYWWGGFFVSVLCCI